MADPTLPEIRPIEGFENYGVSADGRVWRIRPGKGVPAKPLPYPLRSYLNRQGYWYVTIANDVGARKDKRIAPLVLGAFCGVRPQGMVAAHNDGDRCNNTLSNLRWTTQASNIADKARHGTQNRGETIPWAKLTDDAVLELRCLPPGRLPDGAMKALMTKFSMSERAITNARRGKSWKHVAA